MLNALIIFPASTGMNLPWQSDVSIMASCDDDRQV